MSKGTKPEETVDLLVELLETHKPHLKPYSERLKSWVDMLQEYNEVAGTHYKQPRTLKRRFERIVDMYRVDKSLPSCHDPTLLSRLIDEYNKPYRLVQRTDYGSVESNDINLEPLRDVTNSDGDNIITTKDVSKTVLHGNNVLLQPIREEENESMNGKTVGTNTEIIQTNQAQKRLLKEVITQKKKQKRNTEKLNYTTSNNTVPQFDMHDLLQSDALSKESSTQPLPLDTITLGEQLLPRQSSIHSDEETDDQDIDDYRSYSSDPSVSTTKRVKTNGTNLMRKMNNHYQNDTVSTDIPKSIFILDKNDKLLELMTRDNGTNISIEGFNDTISNILNSGRSVRQHIEPDEYSINKDEMRHYNNNIRGQKSATSSILSSRKRGKITEISKPYNLAKTNPNKLSFNESQILSELNQIRLEQRAFQAHLISKLDTIMDILSKQHRPRKPSQHSHR